MTSERRDYLAAFAIGAALGAGVTVLLAPRRKRKRRLELELAGKRFRKRGSRLRKTMRGWR